jgi:cysteine desulfurase/selenocysteine lyase
MNIENIKSQFPIFLQKTNGKPLVYLDSSNSSQKPICVINRLNDFYKNKFSNIGRSIHSLAVSATNKFEETRMSVKILLMLNLKMRLFLQKMRLNL